MTKILYVITQGEMGGAQRYVFDLATNLDPNQYEILVACGAEKAELKEKLATHRIPVKLLINLVRNINPLKDWLAVLELKKLFLAYKPDLIHLNSGKAGFLGSLAAHFAGNKNVIFTAHGFTFLEPNSWLLRKIYLWAEKLARSWRKKIICVSEYDRQQALKHKVGTETQLVTIHNGISIGKSENQKIRNPIFPTSDQSDSPVIGTIAHLYPTKGIKYLIEAAKIVTVKFPNAKFVIIGDGPEKQNLNLQQNIAFLGRLPDATRYLPGFHVFVLPSIKEGFPYTILEAMAAGLPIVATRVGGIPEMISDGQNGLLVPPQNSAALAQGILKILRDPEFKQQIAARALERAKIFSLQKMLSETQKIYASLI